MKRLFALLLIFLTLAGILKELSVYISFKANQTQIVNTLCASRDLSNNTCQGTCYLEKQLKITHEHDATPKPSNKKVPFLNDKINFYFENYTIGNRPIKIYSKLVFNSSIYSKINKGFPTTIFHPPIIYVHS